MNYQPTIDEENEKQQSTTTTNKRPIRSELLTKIYYPDTLYPDSYTFFADRRSQPMDANDQSPTTDPQRTSTNMVAIPKQATNEIEMTERQSKYSVSVDCI
jgi:hypothetical protein